LTTLDFWFEFGSTYSYLSASRIGTVADAVGVEVRWQPFLLGPLFREFGWDDSPFNLYPVKGHYMWRDMQRLCEGYGLPFQKPSVFPRNGLLAARVCCVCEGELWLPSFIKATFEANFGHDLDIACPGVLRGLLDGLGQSGQAILQEASGEIAKQRLREHTDRAREIGIFGAPSFVVGAELYWGNDRLSDAIACAATRGIR
jgi:2-hydroxychromene-2-carboxylate isomerase